MTPPAYPHTRWNFVIIVLDASFFFAAFAFIDPVAVLPILVTDLNGSRVVVGLLSAIQRAGWLIPQLVAVSFVLHRPRKKPFVIYPCIISRLPFLGLAVVFNLPWAGSHPQALLLILIGVYTLFFFGDGLAGVPWHDIIGRTIPPNLRGRFFGSIQFFGGLWAVGAGAIVRHTLADTSIDFPQNYGRLFVLLCFCMLASTVFVALIREPPSAVAREAQSLRRIIRSVPSVLRKHPLLKKMIIGQILCGVAGLALPFYAVYADAVLGLPASVSGLFIWCGIAGSVGASLIWAYLSDRFGSTAVIRGVSWLVIAAPLSALLVPIIVRMLGADAAMPYAYSLVFLLNGATWGGLWMGFTNYVLEISPVDIRPLFLGIQATLSSPTVLMPLLGGLLLNVLPFEVLFGFVAACGVFSVIYAYRLPEPRAALENVR